MNNYAKAFFFICILVVLTVFIAYQRNNPSQVSESLNLTPTIAQDNTGNLSFVETLRKREYKPSQITIDSSLSGNNSYKSYIFSYRSDDLKIYGRMNVPSGDGPFPVIILNHGYFNANAFTSGDGTQTMADILAKNGYLTLASDYRGFGKSDNDSQGSRGHNPNYAIDVLNMIASVKNVDKADPDRIGMWGHSMGGEVSIRTAEVTDKVKAVVLWAPTSTNTSVNAAFYGGDRRTSSTTDQNNESAYSKKDISYITAPISLHQGLSDTEVNPEWSKELNDVLKANNKTVEYFEYPGQDHNFRNLGWDEISKRTLDFFDGYLK